MHILMSQQSPLMSKYAHSSLSLNISLAEIEWLWDKSWLKLKETEQLLGLMLVGHLHCQVVTEKLWLFICFYT